MKLYFVRHGQTEFNRDGIIQGGSVDAPLTEKGILGAIKLGKYLRDISFDKVVTSPQKRAIDTANYILSENKVNPKLLTDDRLREIKFGEYDGKTLIEFEKAGFYEVFRNQPDQYDKNPVGESYKEVTKRAKNALDDIVKSSNDNDQILIVAHCITLTSLIKHLNNVEIKDYRKDGVLDNTSVTIFEYNDNKYEMLKYNYVPK